MRTPLPLVPAARVFADIGFYFSPFSGYQGIWFGPGPGLVNVLRGRWWAS